MAQTSLKNILNIACFLLVPSAVAADVPTCQISHEKRREITAVLCGQYSEVRVYKMTGPGCAKRSATKRLEDSAIQIWSYERCGDHAFAARLKEGVLRSMGFLEVLSVCTPETIDFSAIL